MAWPKGTVPFLRPQKSGQSPSPATADSGMFWAGANMSYRQSTAENRSPLKRFSHRRRFLKTADLLSLADGQRLLDYGSGDGYLLTLIASRPVHCELVGYEPPGPQLAELQQRMRGTRIQWISDTSGQPDGSFDRVACCEVLEHLLELDQRRVLADIRRLLNPLGLAVMSVPIEVGVASLAKNLARIAIRQPGEETSVKKIVRALFGLRGPREAKEGYIRRHIGFRHQDLLPLLSSAGFRIVRRAWSPLPGIGPVLNSQVLYVLRPT